jgi:hypothetical protein
MEWVFLVVSVCALVVAAVGAGLAQRAFLAATGAAERAEADRRDAGDRAQAEKVAAWPISERETFQRAIERGVVGAAIRNASPMPIYNGSVKLVPSAEMRVRIRFADALGRRWSRDDNGVLAPLG